MRVRSLVLIAVAAPLALAVLFAGTRPLVMARNGVVVSGHHLASEAGLAMLRQGGNAVDAGVATVFAQAVVEFDRFGFGGEVPILIHLANQNKTVAINGHGPAPRAATLEWFTERGIELMPGDCFLPAVVPAVMDTLTVALGEFGTMTLAEVLGPAIDLAENGFAMYDPLRGRLASVASRFKREWPTSAKIFLPGGEVPEVGDLLVQKDLARTFRRLVEAEAAAQSEGREAGLRAARDLFYRGEIAREAVAFQRGFECEDEAGFTSAGLLAEEDFAAYRAQVEEPARTTYRGVEVFKAGFWSQGPVLLQALNLLEGYDLRKLGHNSPAYIHLVAEAMKLAYADREWYYADPNFVGVPEEGLLSKDYASERRKLIDLEVPSLQLRPGNPYPFDPRRAAAAEIPQTVALRPDPPGTTGTRAADAAGNVFSATPSGGWFPTSPILDGLGFVLGTRGQSFWLEQGRANTIEPGKKPRTTLTPSLAVQGGDSILAWGTPGGDVQDQVNLQVFLNIAEFGMDLQEAIEAPLFQILDFPTSFYPRDARPGSMLAEGRIDPETIEELRKIGYDVRLAGDWVIGDATAAQFDRRRGILLGAAGMRRNKSYAVAW